MRKFLLICLCFALIVPALVNADDKSKAAREKETQDADEAIDDRDSEDSAPAALDAEDDAEGDAEEQD